VLYVIAGDGTGNQKEIEGTLADLMAKSAEAGEEEFWFALQPGDKATTAYIVKWFKDHEVYFDSIGAKLSGANEQRSDDPAELVEFMQEYEAAGVEFLALFVDPNGSVDEDAALMERVEAAMEAGFTVKLLNEQMKTIRFEDSGTEEVEEEQTGTLTEDEDEGPVEEDQQFTEADLKKMTVPELTALAKGQGLDVKAIGKAKGELVAAILAQQEAVEEAEEELEEALEAALEADEDVVASNGYSDPTEAVKTLLRALGKALIEASK
jgi:hypothetical protein